MDHTTKTLTVTNYIGFMLPDLRTPSGRTLPHDTFHDDFKTVGGANTLAAFARECDDGTLVLSEEIGRYIVGVGGAQYDTGALSATARRDTALALISALAGSDDVIDGVGLWHGPDGTAYVDAVRAVPEREHALRLAREHGELAIFDAVEGRAIDVPEAPEDDGADDEALAKPTPALLRLWPCRAKLVDAEGRDYAAIKTLADAQHIRRHLRAGRVLEVRHTEAGVRPRYTDADALPPLVWSPDRYAEAESARRVRAKNRAEF